MVGGARPPQTPRFLAGGLAFDRGGQTGPPRSNAFLSGAADDTGAGRGRPSATTICRRSAGRPQQLRILTLPVRNTSFCFCFRNVMVMIQSKYVYQMTTKQNRNGLMSPRPVRVPLIGVYLRLKVSVGVRPDVRPDVRAARVSSAAPKKKSFDRGGPVWPPRSNVTNDRLGGGLGGLCPPS